MTLAMGYGTPRVISEQRFLQGLNGLQYVPGPIILDASRSYDAGSTDREWIIRAGHFLAYNASTGKWCPVKRTRVNGDFSSDVTFIVDDAHNFMVGDVLTVGGDTSKTITAIDYDTNEITVGGSAFTIADNDVVFCSVANEGYPQLLLMEDVSLRDTDNITAMDRPAIAAAAAQVYRAGVLSDIESLLADSSSKAALMQNFLIYDGDFANNAFTS